MKQVTLTKLSEAPNPRYPNNIAVGKEVKGEFVDHPKIGESFSVGEWWGTSAVVAILSDDTFQTYNSIYKYTISE